MLSDFTPIVAHYDESTLLTKDGQLIRILAIKGYSDRFKKLDLPLDQKLRQLLNKNLNENLMLYNITKRDFTSLLKKDTSYKAIFAKTTSELWIEKNNFNNCLMNSLYLVIVHKGGRDLYSNFLASFSKNFFTKSFFKKLAEASIELDSLLLNLLQDLEGYGASLLSVKLDQEEMESEPLSFIYYLLHLKEKNISIAKGDFSKILTADLLITNNYADFLLERDVTKELDYEAFMEGEPSPVQEENHLAIITVKGLKSLPTSYNDKILSLDNQLLIVESLSLAPKSFHKKSLQNFLDLYEISKLDYGNQLLNSLKEYKAIEGVTTFILFDKEPQELQKSLSKITELFFDLGLNFVVEDYHKLSAFFGILPGNSSYIKRKNFASLKESCNFTKIQQKALGGYQGSKWGQALTIFKSLDNLPFFFNFQNSKGLGHTIITGPSSHYNNLLQEWLLSESLKFNSNIINFNPGITERFIELIGGEIRKPSSNLIVDLNLEAETLAKLLKRTFLWTVNEELEKNLLILLEEIINKFKVNNYQEIKNLIKNANCNLEIKKDLENFFNQDYFFNNQSENNLSGIISFSGLEEIYQPIMEALYLQKLNKSLPKQNLHPYIITISLQGLIKASEIIEKFSDLLQELAGKEVVIIIATKKDKITQIKDLLQLFPTNFFFSDKYFDRSFAEIFGLTYGEVNSIKMYNPQDMIFLLKQDDFRLISSCKLLESFQLSQ